MKGAQSAEFSVKSAQPARVHVEILLATCNSAEFLPELLESLLSQTETDFHLMVSDDCSGDTTVNILESYADRFRHPVHIIRRDRPSGSAAANFASLLQASRGDFVFLCDADDVWHPNKLTLFLERAIALQMAGGDQEPLFLFSDADVIDATGVKTHESYWAFKNTAPERCLKLSRLLVCTPMIGCATLMNRALVELARNVPLDKVTGHDWWALLVAAGFGKVDYLPEKTISYRIHAQNSSKPLQVSLSQAGRMRRMTYEVRRRLAIRRKQAAPLLEQFGDRLPQETRRTIERFLALEHQSFISRRLTMFLHGYSYPDRLRNLALLLFS